MSHLPSCSRIGTLAALPLLLFAPNTVHGEEQALRQAIDAAIQSGWQKHDVKPAQRSNDAEFLRRIYLDLVGVIPTYEETVAFLDSKEPDKREKMIDQLLADPRFAQH